MGRIVVMFITYVPQEREIPFPSLPFLSFGILFLALLGQGDDKEEGGIKQNKNT